MTREETIEAIKVMQAWLDGEKVQVRSLYASSDEWHDICLLRWNFAGNQYRIKPKPLEVWHWVFNDNYPHKIYHGKHKSKKLCEDFAKSNNFSPGKAVRFVAQDD